MEIALISSFSSLKPVFSQTIFRLDAFSRLRQTKRPVEFYCSSVKMSERSEENSEKCLDISTTRKERFAVPGFTLMAVLNVLFVGEKTGYGHVTELPAQHIRNCSAVSATNNLGCICIEGYISSIVPF